MATKQQIPVMAARLTEFQEVLQNLSVEDAQWVIINGKKAAELFVLAVMHRNRIVADFFKVLGPAVSKLIVPATIETFVARDKFKVNTTDNEAVKISSLGRKFLSLFLEKSEAEFAGSVVGWRRLEKHAMNSAILTELGGQQVAKTTLAELFAVLSAQPNGESGDLSSSWANIFYIENINSLLSAVVVSWEESGWSIEAFAVESGSDWDPGDRIFFRNSDLAT